MIFEHLFYIDFLVDFWPIFLDFGAMLGPGREKKAKNEGSKKRAKNEQPKKSQKSGSDPT